MSLKTETVSCFASSKRWSINGKEFDTYKVGTVANSCSTMHKIHAKEFEMSDFSCEHLISAYDAHELEAADPNYIERACVLSPSSSITDENHCFIYPKELLDLSIQMLNTCRRLYLETGDKRYWWQMIQILPTPYNQKRTVMLNYEVLSNIYHARKDHKLDEWHDFCHWVEQLPESWIITEKRKF